MIGVDLDNISIQDAEMLSEPEPEPVVEPPPPSEPEPRASC